MSPRRTTYPAPFPIIERPLRGYWDGWREAPWAILVHYSATFDAASCMRALASRGLSTHLTIARDGTYWRHVAEENRALHAGYGSWAGRHNMNNHSLSFEIANLGWLDGEFHPESYEGSVYDPRDSGIEEIEVSPSGLMYYRDERGRRGTTRIVTRTECVKVSDHRRGWSEKWWSSYTERQLLAVFWQISDWMARYNILPEYVLGHEHVTPHRKQDPGPHFPWAALKKFLERVLRRSNPELFDPRHRMPERIKSLQSQCHRLGLSPGAIDGIWGRRTETAVASALNKYSKPYGLPQLNAIPGDVYEVACELRRVPGFPAGSR